MGIERIERMNEIRNAGRITITELLEKRIESSDDVFSELIKKYCEQQYRVKLEGVSKLKKIIDAIDSQIDDFNAFLEKSDKDEKEISKAIDLTRRYPEILENKRKIIRSALGELTDDEINNIDENSSALERYLDAED